MHIESTFSRIKILEYEASDYTMATLENVKKKNHQKLHKVYW